MGLCVQYLQASLLHITMCVYFKHNCVYRYGVYTDCNVERHLHAQTHSKNTWLVLVLTYNVERKARHCKMGGTEKNDMMGISICWPGFLRESTRRIRTCGQYVSQKLMLMMWESAFEKSVLISQITVVISALEVMKSIIYENFQKRIFGCFIR